MPTKGLFGAQCKGHDKLVMFNQRSSSSPWHLVAKEVLTHDEPRAGKKKLVRQSPKLQEQATTGAREGGYLHSVELLLDNGIAGGQLPQTERGLRA